MVTRIQEEALQYEDFGKGPTVVILHDYPSNRELREGHFEALAEAGCRVVVTNPGGLGQEEWPDRETAAYTRKVVALFNYLGIGRAVVIGISLGGYVLVDLMERFPERVAAGSFVASPAMAEELRRRARRPEVLAALRAGRCDDLARAFPAALPAVRAARPGPAQLHRLRAWAGSVRARSRAGFRRGRRDCSALLAGFALPTLLVEGEEEAVATPPAGRSRLGSLQHHLQHLVQALLPPEELCEAEDEAGGRLV